MTTMMKTKKLRPAKRAAVTAKATIQVRVDAKTKSRAEKIFKRQGLSTSDGIRLLLDKAIAEHGASRIPNAETEKAMRDVRAGRTERVALSELKKRLLDDE